MKKKFKTKYISKYNKPSGEPETSELTVSVITLDNLKWVDFTSIDSTGMSYDGMFPFKNAKQLEDIGKHFFKLAKKYKNYEVK
jgi:hypothetical protein